MNIRNLFIFVTIILLVLLVLAVTPTVALFTGHLSGEQYLVSYDLLLRAFIEFYETHATIKK